MELNHSSMDGQTIVSSGQKELTAKAWQKGPRRSLTSDPGEDKKGKQRAREKVRGKSRFSKSKKRVNDTKSEIQDEGTIRKITRTKFKVNPHIK
mmetsp:Transcript_13773/g.15970  ORF Transcript_13773/g.15970 Transcript_13773/m.15970 type:complete len:94 (-) Transcript_13773:286-567(-)